MTEVEGSKVRGCLGQGLNPQGEHLDLRGQGQGRPWVMRQGNGL